VTTQYPLPSKVYISFALLYGCSVEYNSLADQRPGISFLLSLVRDLLLERFIIVINWRGQWSVLNVRSFKAAVSSIDYYLIRRMASSGMLRRVAFVTTDVSEALSASMIRVTRIGELGT
jgi:hypothetical protein